MKRILICGIDIPRFSGDGDLDFILVPPDGFDDTKISRDFVTSFCAPGKIVGITELRIVR